MSIVSFISESSLTQKFVKGAEYEGFVTESARILANKASELAPGSTGKYIFAKRGAVYFLHPTGVWHLIEYGSINNQAYAPMRRAMGAVDLPHTDAQKPFG